MAYQPKQPSLIMQLWRCTSGVALRQVQWKLSLALGLCLVFMVVEVVGGVLAHSLAVLTDAAHLLSDVSGFGVSLWAAWYASQRSQSTHTFGCASLHTRLHTDPAVWLW